MDIAGLNHNILAENWMFIAYLAFIYRGMKEFGKITVYEE